MDLSSIGLYAAVAIAFMLLVVLIALIAKISKVNNEKKQLID